MKDIREKKSYKYYYIIVPMCQFTNFRLSMYFGDKKRQKTCENITCVA